MLATPTTPVRAAALLWCLAAACASGARPAAARLTPPDTPTRAAPRAAAYRRLRGGAGAAQLADAATFTWEESLPWLRYVRTHGVVQFISVLKRLQDTTNNELLWGDEIEYQLLRVDGERRTVQLSLRASEVLRELSDKEEGLGRRDGVGEACMWHPEYGAWMVEATPRVPYGGFTADLCRVEPNVRPSHRGHT